MRKTVPRPRSLGKVGKTICALLRVVPIPGFCIIGGLLTQLMQPLLRCRYDFWYRISHKVSFPRLQHLQEMQTVSGLRKEP